MNPNEQAYEEGKVNVHQSVPDEDGALGEYGGAD